MPTDLLEELPRMVDFFLYDTLSGGAGYATQVSRVMNELLKETLHILDACPEQCERSCYRCIRTYANRILHPKLDRKLAGVLLRAIISGQPPQSLTVYEQARQLEMLRQFLDLSGGVECQTERMHQGVLVPLMVKTFRGIYAIGSYPVLQDRQAQTVRPPLDMLSTNQIRLYSDYELAHNLPGVAQSFLSH